MRRAFVTKLTVAASLGLAACGPSSIVDEDPDPAEPVVSAVGLNPSTLALSTGEESPVNATVQDALGAAVDGRAIAWASDDASASVTSGAGYAATVEGVSAGSATITASVDGVTGSMSVSVSDAPPPPPPPPPSADECDAAPAEWIWCDDFEVDRLASYFEYDAAGSRFIPVAGVGLDGSTGMRAQWSAGVDNAGSLHLAMGETPQAYFDPVDAGTANYREIYWRLWVRLQPGWTGGGGYKLSRAFIYASPTTWAQAMIAHVWAGDTPASYDYLLIDPASGTDESGVLVTTTYNDFANLRWMGLRQSQTPIFEDARAGTWFCVEAHVRLNQAGSSDGVFQLWIDDDLEAERTDLNWVGSYNEYGLNAVFVENYWNNGAPGTRERYIDNFVVSTARIGC